MKAVEVHELKPGMILARTVTNADFIVLFLANTKLNDKHIALLKTMNIPTVYIKDEFDLSKLYQQVAIVKNKDSSFVHDFEKVARLANKIFKELDADGEIKTAVTMLAARILPMADNPASINYLLTLSHLSTSLAYHSERVAIFAGIIAKWMDFSWDEIKLLVVAAFLHDVGKHKFPPAFLLKSIEKYTAAELQIYRTHCQIGRDMAKKLNLPEPIPTAIFQHHENMNGSGFPMGIRGKETNIFAKIIAVADAYDNFVTEKPGFIKKTPFDAVNFFARSQYSQFDPTVCMPLLTNIRDHFIGSHIMLKDGSKGTVIFYPKDFAAMPVVRLEDGTEINLNTQKDNPIVEYSIT